MKYGIIIPITTVLSACASPQPIVVPEKIPTPYYLPMPVTLVQPVSVVLTTQDTWGSAVGRLSTGLQVCNSQLTAIQQLKPPNPPINPQDKPY